MVANVKVQEATLSPIYPILVLKGDVNLPTNQQEATGWANKK